MDPDLDALLDAVLIGGREKRPVIIEQYNPLWPVAYTALAVRIRDAVGDHAVSLDHIGSTSVPGLAAKPIIDIVLTVNQVEVEDHYLTQLEAAGFVLRVREIGHRMFRAPDRSVHVHVFSDGDPAVPDYLDLRDWLRVDAKDRELYTTTKKRLAQQPWPDMNYYAEAKAYVISSILARARLWRAQTSRELESRTDGGPRQTLGPAHNSGAGS